MPYAKTGYLNESYRLFYNKGMPAQAISYHYHDFHKILILLDGQIGYGIEGRQYSLQSGDIILVGAGEIHSPLFGEEMLRAPESSVYERLILYISPSLSDPALREGERMLACFDREALAGNHLVRAKGESREKLLSLASSLKACIREKGSYAALYEKIKVLELLIALNRYTALEKSEKEKDPAARMNPVLSGCIGYIQAHLSEPDLSIDTIAQALYLSRSYLMHLFREQTGCSIGEYIRDKRLYLAGRLLEEGASVTEAYEKTGFKNYTSFYYAYKKKYHQSPGGRRERVPGHSEE